MSALKRLKNTSMLNPPALGKHATTRPAAALSTPTSILTNTPIAWAIAVGIGTLIALGPNAAWAARKSAPEPSQETNGIYIDPNAYINAMSSPQTMRSPVRGLPVNVEAKMQAQEMIMQPPIALPDELWVTWDANGKLRIAGQQLNKNYTLLARVPPAASSPILRTKFSKDKRFQSSAEAATNQAFQLYYPDNGRRLGKQEQSENVRPPVELGKVDRQELISYYSNSPGYQSLRPLLQQAANNFKVDYNLLKAIITQESRFHTSALSGAGAVGLMQVMPATGERFGIVGDAERSLADKLRDPAISINVGARYLRYLMGLFPNRPDLVLASYNAGEGAVIRYGNRVPNYPETRDYVKKVLQNYLALTAEPIINPPKVAVKRKRKNNDKIEADERERMMERATILASMGQRVRQFFGAPPAEPLQYPATAAVPIPLAVTASSGAAGMQALPRTPLSVLAQQGAYAPQYISPDARLGQGKFTKVALGSQRGTKVPNKVDFATGLQRLAEQEFMRQEREQTMARLSGMQPVDNILDDEPDDDATPKYPLRVQQR